MNNEQSIADLLEASGGIELFSANAIRHRYKKIRGGRKPPTKKTELPEIIEDTEQSRYENVPEVEIP